MHLLRAGRGGGFFRNWVGLVSAARPCLQFAWGCDGRLPYGGLRYDLRAVAINGAGSAIRFSARLTGGDFVGEFSGFAEED
jgi:hypothetical protein